MVNSVRAKVSPAWFGGLLMVAATLAFTGMHALVRHVSGELHPFEIVFFRSLFGLLAVAPLLLRAGSGALATRQPGLHMLRGFNGMIAMLTWFYALSLVPIADATALSFISIIFASVGAVLFLGERMRARRWAAVFFGLAGALIILRPGFQTLNIGMLLILISTAAWGTSIVIVKQLSKTDPVVSIVAWMAIMLTVFSFPVALFVWQWPTPQQFGWLVLIGTLGTVGHLLMTKALQAGDATAVLPLDFTRLIWAALIGYLAFGEAPDRWIWLGGGIIIASAGYIIYREGKLKKSSSVEESPVP